MDWNKYKHKHTHKNITTSSNRTLLFFLFFLLYLYVCECVCEDWYILFFVCVCVCLYWIILFQESESGFSVRIVFFHLYCIVSVWVYCLCVCICVGFFSYCKNCIFFLSFSLSLVWFTVKKVYVFGRFAFAWILFFCYHFLFWFR